MSFSHKYPDGSCSHQAWMTDLRTGECKCADCGQKLGYAFQPVTKEQNTDTK